MLWAVHISEGVLAPAWWLGGYAFAAVLLCIGVFARRRMPEDDYPRVALLTAAFFVASSIHVPSWPASVHLLLNGLVGIMLGWQAALAIFVGLLLQAVLLNHGGYTTLGANVCIQTVPALLAWAMFRAFNRVAWVKHPVGRGALVAAACGLWFLTTAVAVALLVIGLSQGFEADGATKVLAVLGHPAIVVGASAFGAAAALVERRLENAPEFALGLFVGEFTVLLTVALDCGVLTAGGADFGHVPPLLLAVAHLPVAAIEGVVLGFTVGFLAKVKPELLGMAPVLPPPHAAKVGV